MIKFVHFNLTMLNILMVSLVEVEYKNKELHYGSIFAALLKNSYDAHCLEREGKPNKLKDPV